MRFDFLICSERCGSNLITKIADAHSNVCGPFPSHVNRVFVPNLYTYGDLTETANWTALTDDVADYMANIFAQWETSVTAEELRTNAAARSFAAVMLYVYEKEAAARNKGRLFVKENHAFRLVPFYLAHFPDAKFVWLVRDPRDMAHCQRESILPGGVQTAARVWQTDQNETLKLFGALRDTGRILLLTFEQLLSRSEETCRILCQFLDLPYEPAMLEFHRDPNVSKNANTITAWADLGKPLMPDNMNNYREGLSEAEIGYVEAVCHHEMRALGYALESHVDKTPEELMTELPDESRFHVARNEAEKTRYEPYYAMMRRLKERWNV